MRIAVAYDNGEIGLHFGHAEMFAVYDYDDADVSRCTKRLIETGERHGHQAMAELMQAEGVDAVISGNMGGEAKAALLSLGIVPIAGFEGGGSCGGSCSGCSGCGPDCDCGGSCGC